MRWLFLFVNSAKPKLRSVAYCRPDYIEFIRAQDRADAIGRHYAAHGWALAEAQPSTPGSAELEAGPSFAGYPCSPTVNDNGLPTWIIVDGKQAQRREK